MIEQRLSISPEAIADFCQRHHIRKLSLFGSVLRDDFRSDSDIDVLVEFEPDAHVTLFDMGGMQMEISELFGREVDFKTEKWLSPYFRQKVIDTAETIFPC